jgi:ElaB/YqjD/DUF883 family membrane-anchored ribosome-binding protein
MAQDEAVANLLKFNADTGRSSSELGESTSSLEETVEELADLESAAEERIGALASDAQDALRDLGQALDDAGEALDALAEEVEGITTDRVPEAKDGLEDAATDMRDRATSVGDMLQDGFERLAEDGFQGYAQALDDAEAATSEAATENEGAFEAFDGAVEEMSGRADGLRAEGGAALVAAATEAEEQAGTLEAAFTEATSQWDQTVDEQLRSGCDEVGSALDALYASWTEQADAVAEDLASQVQQAMEDVAEALGSGATEAIEESGQEAHEQAAGAFRDELDEDVTALESGEDLAGHLDPLTPQLQVCTQVVDEIDRLLNALD